jgi:hypothetical protein
MSKYVIDVIVEYGRQHGYDGIFCPDGDCGCLFDDFVPCSYGENVLGAEFGYKRDCEHCNEWYDHSCNFGGYYESEEEQDKPMDFCINSEPPLRVPGQLHRCKECLNYGKDYWGRYECKIERGTFDSDGDYIHTVPSLRSKYTFKDAWACEKFEEKK